jgi:VWFA-related protein
MKLSSIVRLFLKGALLALITGASAQDHSLPSSPAGDSASQSKESQTQVPVIRSTAHLVILDVVVSHDGHPVKGLEQKAFHILEDGQEQTIKAFEEHGPVSGPERTGAAPALPPNTYTNVPQSSTDNAINVLLLDALNTPLQDQAYARRKIIEYLKEIPPGTRMAIFTLASRLRMVQGFTSDSSVLLSALNKTVPLPSPALPGNTGENAADRLAVFGVGQDNASAMLESLHHFEADEATGLIDRRVQITLDAMKQLGLYLGNLPGRKNVIWFSASFPLGLTPKTPLDTFGSLRGYSGELQQISDLLTASRVAVYPVDARGLITPASSAQSRPRGASLPLGRGGMIDTSAFPTAPAGAGDRENAEIATMLQLAEQTGGTAFYQTNGIKQALVRTVEDGSSYYTLTYSPGNKKFDGSFRKVQVNLSGHGYRLAYRHGYFADVPTAHSTNTLLNLASPALQPGALASSQIFFRARVLSAGDPDTHDPQPQAGPAGDLASRLRAPVKRYWIEYLADMHQVGAEADSNGVYRSSIEVIAIAYSQDGRLVNANRRAIKLGMPPAMYEQTLETGYPVRNELDLPDGDLWLRLAIHDLSTDRVGSIEVPLRVQVKNAD